MNKNSIFRIFRRDGKRFHVWKTFPSDSILNLRTGSKNKKIKIKQIDLIMLNPRTRGGRML